MRNGFFALATAALLAAPSAAADDKLEVGSPAPKIQVKEWVRGTPVTELKADHTYVVEFWATWCGPCKKSIPHLSELQKQYGDKVTMIGVSVWEEDQSRVAPFVEKMGDKMAYTVAMDLVNDEGDGFMAKNWMQAAKQKGIPSAFIVRDNKIQWIGHPSKIDDTLAKVVAGEWSLEAAAKEKEKASRIQEIQTKLLPAAYQAKKWEDGVALMDELFQLRPAAENEMGGRKFAMLVNGKAFDKAYGYGGKLVDGIYKDDAQNLNLIAWTIVDPMAPLDKQDLDLALRAAERADELTKHSDPAILDTLAKVHFDKGNLEKALEIQKIAAEHAKGSQFEKEIGDRLKQYEEAVETQGV